MKGQGRGGGNKTSRRKQNRRSSNFVLRPSHWLASVYQQDDVSSRGTFHPIIYLYKNRRRQSWRGKQWGEGADAKIEFKKVSVSNVAQKQLSDVVLFFPALQRQLSAAHVRGRRFIQQTAFHCHANKPCLKEKEKENPTSPSTHPNYKGMSCSGINVYT